MLCLLCMPRRPPPQGLDQIKAAAPKQLSAAKEAGGGLSRSRAQTSRQGKAAITIFVSPESKAQIRAALADGGYGVSFQQGLVALINELLAKQNRPPVA